MVVDRANQRLARFEQVKRHAVLPVDFSIEDGTLTPTMKLRRKVVAERHDATIRGLYAAAEAR